MVVVEKVVLRPACSIVGHVCSDDARFLAVSFHTSLFDYREETREHLSIFLQIPKCLDVLIVFPNATV